MNGWAIAIIVYGVIAGGTFTPVAHALLKPITLHDGGPSFEESPDLSDDAKERLRQNFLRIQGTLGFWKQRAAVYGRFHYYAVIWTLLAAVAMPFLAQAISSNDAAAKWFLTLVSAHAAVLLASHRGLKVSQNYQAFRQGESEFYDLYRRLLDRPSSFRGNTEAERLADYFEKVEAIRRLVRNAETDNLPSVSEGPGSLGQS
jgi:ABC-type antimicrobial peptide transport system permease subunit